MRFRAICNRYPTNPNAKWIVYDMMPNGGLFFRRAASNLKSLLNWEKDEVEGVYFYDSFNGRMADIVYVTTIDDPETWLMEILKEE